MDISKSPVVGSIMDLPLLWLFFWLCLGSKKPEQSHSSTVGLKVLAALCLLAGFYNLFVSLHHFPSKTKKQNMVAITKMYQDIGDYAQQHHWPTISFSTDHISDYLSAHSLAVLYFETRQKLLNSQINLLGGTIFTITEEIANNSLDNSNVLIFNREEYKNKSPYPFDQNIYKLKPMVLKRAEREFVVLGDYQFMEGTYRVYVKPA